MRKIPNELADMMRARIPLTDSELAHIEAKHIFRMAAAALEGTRELTGKNDGRTVELIQKTVGLSKGDPWCMAAVQSALAFAEKWSGKSSGIASGGHCLTVHKDSPGAQIAKADVMSGDIIIYRHGQTTNGHAESIITMTAWMVAFTMGGNTSPGPGIEREGDGEFFRMRSLTNPIGTMGIHGILRPFK